MLKHIFKVIYLVIVTTFCASAAAQTKWYSVEYIVFEHTATGSSQEPSSRSAETTTNQALRLLPSSGHGGDWTSFRRLRADEMSLFGAQRSLSTSTRYNARMHAGWLQQLAAEDQPQPVLISTGASDTPIQGTITFRRGRFLHVDIDLTLIDTPALAGVSRNYRATNETHFRLQQTRRIRTQQLHYFDHPRFGVMVKVMPLAPPVVEETVSEVSAEGGTGTNRDNPNPDSHTEIPLPAAEKPAAKP